MGNYYERGIWHYIWRFLGQGRSTLERKYEYWRIRTFYSLFFGYTLFYFTRKSFTFIMPELIQSGFSAQALGQLGSILYISYGISKFASGLLSDRCNPRYFMAFGLIVTGFLNVFFGLSSSLFWFAIFWGLNGWFQGFGWPPITKQLTHWYSKNERGIWWSVIGTSHNVGGAIIPLLIAVCIQWQELSWAKFLPSFMYTVEGWRWAMCVPGFMCIIGGIFLLERLRDVPHTLGLPPIEDYRQDPENIETDDSTEPLSVVEILFQQVLNNRFIWILALSYFFVYVVRTALNDWTLVYLTQVKNYDALASAATIVWFEVGGLLGMLAAGFLTDKFFKGKRMPFILFCSLGLIVSIFAFWKNPIHAISIDYILMGCAGFFVFGPQMLVGLASAEAVNKKASCTANGFVGCSAYAGAAAAGYPLGYVIDNQTWDHYFIYLIICSAAIILILLPMVSEKKQQTMRDKWSQKPAFNKG